MRVYLGQPGERGACKVLTETGCDVCPMLLHYMVNTCRLGTRECRNRMQIRGATGSSLLSSPPPPPPPRPAVVAEVRLDDPLFPCVCVGSRRVRFREVLFFPQHSAVFKGLNYQLRRLCVSVCVRPGDRESLLAIGMRVYRYGEANKTRRPPPLRPFPPRSSSGPA